MTLTLTVEELREQLATRSEDRDRMLRDQGDVQARARRGDEDASVRQRAHDLDRGLANVENEINDLTGEIEDAESRQARLRDLADDDAHREDGATFHTPRRTSAQPGTPAAFRDDALRAVERMADTLGSDAGDRLTGVIERDRSGLDSRYVEAVADEHYEAAFARRLGDPDGAPHSYTAEEAAAMRRVSEATAARAMAVGTGSAGGFAIPATLDPTIMLTSDGALSPLRGVAQVTSISTSEWKGVSSAGVTASFAGEGDQVGDNTPTLGQPSIIPERAHSFVPFSFEVGMDWPGLRDELLRLFSDAKNVLEAEKFLTGAGHGSEEPEGLIAGLDPSKVIETDGPMDADDVYGQQEALPPRFQPRAGWLSSAAAANAIYRWHNPSGDEPPLFSPDRRSLLGKPWREVSDMDAGSTVGDDALIYGDIGAGFRIVDRIGMSVELVPHLLGADRRPTGQRGMYAFWRVSSGVVNDNAIRVLKIGAAGSGSGSGD